ncbi:unnamed protein product [Ostreobium quekettii]|uniref:Thioredoxin domain-containing protein n=1 Tax=Ostreobium quekettii TaxID=121088 RepID=A0A8S1ITK0_9CHLO|nr:unnamed protein product [Ostreobium quekettii]|eukprot:evm.model.scf_1198EXC.4 EVM.evm.TU.scf_1198EXC.4   scf_1198EXC:39293-41247(-)
MSAVRFLGDRSAIGAVGQLRRPLQRCHGRVGTRLCVRAAKKEQFASFDDMISGSSTPLLVDFYAKWCGPCQMIVPILSAASKRLGDKVKVVKIDTEKYPRVASKHRVEALPTIILFRNGKVVDRVEGFLDEQTLVARVNYFLGQQTQG